MGGLTGQAAVTTNCTQCDWSCTAKREMPGLLSLHMVAEHPDSPDAKHARWNEQCRLTAERRWTQLNREKRGLFAAVKRSWWRVRFEFWLAWFDRR